MSCSRFTLHAYKSLTLTSRLLAAGTTSLRLGLLGLAAALGHRLTHEGKLALLRLEAEGEEVLDGLLARRRLTTGNDATLLKEEIALLQTA